MKFERTNIEVPVYLGIPGDITDLSRFPLTQLPQTVHTGLPQRQVLAAEMCDEFRDQNAKVHVSRRKHVHLKDDK